MLTVNCPDGSVRPTALRTDPANNHRDNEVFQGLTETSRMSSDSLLSHQHSSDLFGFIKSGNIKCCEAS